MSDYAAGYRKWANEENENLQAKQKYRSLKRKLRCLLYEQECFQEELRRLQRKLLRVNRDKSFLLDRLLQYEPPEFSSSDEEETASSSEESQHLKSYWNSQNGSQYQETPKTKLWFQSCFVQARLEGFGKTSKRKEFLPLAQDESAKKQHVYTDSSSQESKTQLKSKKSADNVEKIRCKHVENGKRCPKMVSRRVKSGLCLAHRGGDVKQAKSTKQASHQRITTIQPRDPIDYFSQPNPMISGISNDHLPASAASAIPEGIYEMPNMHQDSNAADSPASSDFHSNIYEGADDLVIDLPE